MKKKSMMKKVLAFGLSLACVLATSTVAFAAPGTDTIDTGHDCSLTIHKYDYTAAMEDGVDVTSLAQNYSDGKQHTTEVENVMKDYVIPDVEFTYVKVGEINTVSENGKVAVMYDIEDTALRNILGLTHSTWPEEKPRSDYKFTSDEINEAMKALLNQEKSTPFPESNATNTKGKIALENYIKSANGATAMDETDANGTTSASGLDQGLYLIVETKVPANVKYTVDPFFVSLPMTDVQGESWFYDVTVYPKNQTDIPTLDKKVRQHDDAVIDPSKHEQDLKYYDIATGSEGDVMDYILVSHLPEISSGATHLTKFEFTDKVDYGINYNQGSFKIRFYDTQEKAFANNPADALTIVDKDGSNGTNQWEEKGPYFTVTYSGPADDKNQAVIALTAEGLAAINRNTDENGQAQCSKLFMTVSYDGTVSSDAKVVLGDHGNLNDVTLEWRRTWDSNYDQLHDEARVYTFGLNLTKKFDGPSGIAEGKDFNYADVKFVLQNDTDKHYIKATGSDGNYYVTDGDKSETEDGATIFSPDSSGNLKINGLEADTYILTEVETSDGFSLLKEPITIVINCTVDNITPSVTHLYDAKDAANGTEYPTAITVVAGDRASATVDGNDTAMSEDGGTVTSANARVDMTVVNTSDFLLPQTGGLGTILFTLIGCAAALAGVIIFMKRDPKEAK